MVQRYKLRGGNVPPLSEQRFAFLRKMRHFVWSLVRKPIVSSMLRSCLALVSRSCLHPAALSVSRAHKAHTPRLTPQLGSNHTVPIAD